MKIWPALLYFCTFVWGDALAQSHVRSDNWAISWADSVIGQGVADGRASAASVAIVAGGKVVALKGYGVVDGPGSRAVDPARDQFQIASVTKTFTGALLAQLVGQGRIASLDGPAQAYMRRAKLPVWGGKSITLRQLVTHSAGFEERGVSYFAHGRTSVPASEDYIARAMPELVREPGSLIVYANIDPALVGVAIEDITGGTLKSEMAARLFAPLGMERTGLVYDQRGLTNLVSGYAGDHEIPKSFNAPFFAPTGSVETTAADMAIYLNAMLGHRPDVLSPASLDLLRQPLARNHRALDAVGVYWFLTRWGEADIVEHAGGLSGVGAWAILVPGSDIGMFVAWAGGSPTFDYGLIHDSFLEASLGDAEAAPEPGVPADFSRHVGRYWDERRPHTTSEMIFGLDAVREVTASAAGLWIGGQGPYVETEPGVFRRIAAPGRLGDTVVFDNGKLIQRTGYARRVGGWNDPTVQTFILHMALGLAITGFLSVIWPAQRLKWVATATTAAAIVVPVALYAPGFGGGFIAEMQAGSHFRFHVIAASTMVLAAGGAGLLGAITIRAFSDRRALARAPFSAAHALLVGAGSSLAALVLIGWDVFNLPRL